MRLPEPWLGTVQASLRLIDQVEAEIDSCERELRTLGADHPYVPNLLTVPGIGWVLAYTIASEIGDVDRFASPKKLCGYTGLCPSVYQSGGKDRRGALKKNGPTYLRWRSSRQRCMPSAIPRTPPTTKPPRSGSASSAAARLHVVMSRAVSPKPSGTCSLAIKRSLRQPPQGV